MSTETPELTKAEDKDLHILARQAHVPVSEIKAVPEAPVKTEKSPQDEFNDGLRKLSKTVLELVEGGNSDRGDQVKRVVEKTIKFAHLSKYHTTNLSYNPLEV